MLRLPRPGGVPAHTWIPWAIFGLAVLLFSPAIGAGFTTWDDDLYVVRNPAIRDLGLASLWRMFSAPAICNYHPLTILTYALEHALVGLEPWLYHLTNVLLHGLASVLAFQLSRRWLGQLWPAALTAALFAAHPLRVESVAWIAERKDVLCGFLYLATLLAYTQALEAEETANRRSSIRLHAAALTCFVLALLAKVMAVSVPAVLLALLVARRSVTRRRLALLMPYAALACLLAVIGVLAHRAEGAVQGPHGGSWWLNSLSVLKAVGFYASKLAAPLVLSPRYVLEPAAGPGEPLVLAGIAVSLALGAAAVLSLRGDRRVFLGICLWAAAWAPTSGLVPLSTLVADRYLYLPGLGLFLALAAALGAWPAERGGWSPRARRVGLVTVGLLAAPWLALTPLRAALWRDEVALWSDALRENPRNPFAFNQLAVAHLAAGRHGEAAAATLEAARHGLRAPAQLFNLALAHEGLGDETRELAVARSIAEATPSFLPARLVLVRHRLAAGDLAGAEQELAQLAAEHGELAVIWLWRGRLSEARGDMDPALGAYLRAVSLEPALAEAWIALGRRLLRAGDVGRAATCLERAVALRGALATRAARLAAEELARELAAMPLSPLTPP